jgi:hypothetical protein
MLARSAFSIQASVQSYRALGMRDHSWVARSSFRNARRFLIGVRNENAWIVAVCAAMKITELLQAAAADRGSLKL